MKRKRHCFTGQMQKAMASFDRDKGDKYLYAVIGNESLGLALQSVKRQRLRQNLPVTVFDVLQMREELAGDTELVSPVMNEFLEDGLDGLDSYGFRKSVKRWSLPMPNWKRLRGCAA